VFVCILPGKAVPKMTCTVSGGTLLTTHSLTEKLFQEWCIICQDERKIIFSQSLTACMILYHKHVKHERWGVQWAWPSTLHFPKFASISWNFKDSSCVWLRAVFGKFSWVVHRKFIPYLAWPASKKLHHLIVWVHTLC